MKRIETAIKMAQGKARAVKGGVVVVLATGATLAHAAGEFDVTTVVTAIVAAGVAVATIGAAVLIVKIGGRAWKWISGAA